MMVYHLSRARFKTDLSGKGAELAGGRWNSKGTAILYTSESIALCTVEIAVHMPLGIVPKDYYLVKIALPDTAPVQEIYAADLPTDWKSFPHPNMTQEIGDAFVQAQENLILKVPSAVVEGNFNYLVNPAHKQFPEISIIETLPFEFDRRLFVKE